MKRHVYLLTLLLMSHCLTAKADIHLRNLAELSPSTCLETLQNASLDDIQESFSKGQTDLFVNHEVKLLKNLKGWNKIRNVLEVGSGDGYYLNRLACAFPEKEFVGIDKNELIVNQANRLYNRIGLQFIPMNLEKLSFNTDKKFDAIIFHLALQNLKHPISCLQKMYAQLKENGLIIIIESCDSIKKSSHEISSIQKAMQKLNQPHFVNHLNRYISLEILNAIVQKQSELNHYYTLQYTNINAHAELIEPPVVFKNRLDRQRLFNHGLLLLSKLNQEYEVPVNFANAYIELKNYLEDEDSWMIPGMHFLVLEKS